MTEQAEVGWTPTHRLFIGRGLWTLPSLWTPRPRPQVTWKTAHTAVSHSDHSHHHSLPITKGDTITRRRQPVHRNGSGPVAELVDLAPLDERGRAEDRPRGFVHRPRSSSGFARMADSPPSTHPGSHLEAQKTPSQLKKFRRSHPSSPFLTLPSRPAHLAPHPMRGPILGPSCGFSNGPRTPLRRPSMFSTTTRPHASPAPSRPSRIWIVPVDALPPH